MKTTSYEEFGIAAMLPGIIRAHELLGKEIEELKARLAGMQNGHVTATAMDRLAVNGTKPKAKRSHVVSEAGRKAIGAATKARWKKAKAAGLNVPVVPSNTEIAKAAKKAKKKSGTTRRGSKPTNTHGWASMTPEERSVEMKRRLAVSRGEVPSHARHRSAVLKAQKLGRVIAGEGAAA